MSGSASVDEVGVALCIVIFGVPVSPLFCVRNEFLLLPDGGGDLSLGEMGQEGVLLSLGVLDVVPPLAGLGTLEAGSDVGAGCNCGVAAADNAL